MSLESVFIAYEDWAWKYKTTYSCGIKRISGLPHTKRITPASSIKCKEVQILQMHA